MPEVQKSCRQIIKIQEGTEHSIDLVFKVTSWGLIPAILIISYGMLTILNGGHNVNINSVSMHNQDTKKIHYATGKDQDRHVILHIHV